MEGTSSKMEKTGDQVWGGKLSSISGMLIWKMAEEVDVVIPPSEQECKAGAWEKTIDLGLSTQKCHPI